MPRWPPSRADPYAVLNLTTARGTHPHSPAIASICGRDSVKDTQAVVASLRRTVRLPEVRG